MSAGIAQPSGFQGAAAIRRLPLKTQRGFGLVEMVCVLAVMMMVALWKAGQDVEAANDQQAYAAGIWLGVVRDGVEQVLGAHYTPLSEGRSPVSKSGKALFADALAPTLQELVATGHLPNDFPTLSPLGFTAHIALRAAPVCPAAGCRLDAVVQSSQPVVMRDVPVEDTMRIAQIMSGLAGKGAWVSRRVPARFVGLNVNLPNPFGATHHTASPGTVGAWAGLDRNSALQYLRVGDTRDPDFRGGVSIAGHLSASGFDTSGVIAARSLSASESVSAHSLRAIDAVSARSVQASEAVSARSLRASAAIYAQSLWASDEISAKSISAFEGVSAKSVLAREGISAHSVWANESVSVGSYFLPTVAQKIGSYCAVVGAISRDGAGMAVSCQDGKWQNLSNGFGGVYRLSKFNDCNSVGASRNPRTGECSCPLGYRAVDMSSNRGYINEGDMVAYLCIR